MAFLLTTAMPLMACGGEDSENEDSDDTDDEGGGSNAPDVVTCMVWLAPVAMDYVVSGDLLEISINGQNESWERVSAGDPTREVYGTWHVATETTPGLGTIRLDFLIEPDQVSALGDCDFGTVSANVRATSAAEITDVSITILEAVEDTEEVMR